VNENELTKTPLPNFVTSSKGSLQEESDMPRMRISDGEGENVKTNPMTSIFDR